MGVLIQGQGIITTSSVTGGQGGAGGAGGDATDVPAATFFQAGNGATGGTGGAGGNAIQSGAQSVVVVTGGNVTGGDGGSGGKGGLGGKGFGGGANGVPGAGGVGADGGHGIVLGASSQVTIDSVATVNGGAGGDGGMGGRVPTLGIFANGGDAGNGGAGVSLEGGSTLINRGTITGGDAGQGGAPGGGGASQGISGTAGAGVLVIGDGTYITTSGLIAGGSGGASGTDGKAVDITGNNNTVELQDGFAFTGNVVAAGTNNALAFGGSGDINFNATLIGVQYTGFTAFQTAADGTGTYTLQNNPTQAVTPWTLMGGKLSVADNAQLGDVAGGAITFNGGTLQVTGTTFTDFGARQVNWGANGGGFEIADPTNTFTVTQSLTTGGPLSLWGPGTLVLTGDNMYSGGTTINSGTLQLGNGLLTGSITGDVLNNGTLAFNRSNSYLFDGKISGSGAVHQMGPGTTVLTADNDYTGLTTISAGTLQLGNGGPTGKIGTGAVSVAAGATLAFDLSSTYTFDNAITGLGGVTQKGSGTTIFNTNQGYTGPTSIDAGALLVNGSITSNTTVNSGGTLGGFGTVTGNVDNFGNVTPGTPGDGPGSLGKQLTVDGNYVGHGGKLNIYTQLGDDSSPTSQLVINGPGHTATGTTGIVVSNVGGLGALTTGLGIPIVVPTGGASIGAGAFGANGSVVPGAAQGTYQYLLFQGTGGDTTYYLRSHGDAPPPGGGGPFLPPGEPVPLFRSEVSIFSAMAGLARQQELTTLGTFHERNGDQRLAAGAGPRTAAWGRLFGEQMEQSHSGLVGASFDGSTGGLQSGVDAMQWVNASGHQDRLGMFAAYARTTGTVSGFALGIPNAVAGRAELDGTSIGGYWTHLAPTGWYTDAVLMGTRFDGDGSALGNQVEVTGYGVIASLEGGYPITIAPGVRLEPQAQLVYQHLNLDDVNDAFSHVAYDTPDALFGRVGVRLSADLLPLPYVLRPYLKANVWQAFTETDSIRFNAVHVVDTRHRATTLELGGGVVWQLSPSTGLWLSGDYTTDIASSENEREAVRGTAGIRIVW